MTINNEIILVFFFSRIILIINITIKSKDSLKNVVKKGDGFLKVISEENNKEEIQDEEMLILNAKRKKTAFGDNLLEGKSKDD